MAQSIQRELEEVAVKQADLEQEGVIVEKALRVSNRKFTSSLSPRYLNHDSEAHLWSRMFQTIT